MAKAALHSLTQHLAMEFADRGIRVNAVAPGFIADTEGVERFSEVADQSANALSGDKADIANTVLFLASDAGRCISGECIRVDGAACVDLLKMPVD